MTKFQTVLLAILAGLVAGLLYKFVPDQPALAGGVASIALLLLGWAKQHPADATQIAGQPKDSGRAHVTTMALLASTSLAAFAGLALTPACHNVTPDQFRGAVVDCAKVNPQTSAALSQVWTCFMSTVSGNPSACLAGLVTEFHFTIDEVACVTAYIAQQENAKVAAGTAETEDLQTRRAAVDWLKQEGIEIRNSYPLKN